MRVRCAQIGELFDHRAAEPVGVLHHRFDRGDQFELAVSALMDILDHPQNAHVVMKRNDFGGDQAVNEPAVLGADARIRSEEHTSELQSLMRISYAVFCLKNKTHKTK